MRLGFVLLAVRADTVPVWFEKRNVNYWKDILLFAYVQSTRSGTYLSDGKRARGLRGKLIYGQLGLDIPRVQHN